VIYHELPKSREQASLFKMKTAPHDHTLDSMI